MVRNCFSNLKVVFLSVERNLFYCYTTIKHQLFSYNQLVVLQKPICSDDTVLLFCLLTSIVWKLNSFFLTIDIVKNIVVFEQDRSTIVFLQNN